MDVSCLCRKSCFGFQTQNIVAGTIGIPLLTSSYWKQRGNGEVWGIFFVGYITEVFRYDSENVKDTLNNLNHLCLSMELNIRMQNNGVTVVGYVPP